MKISSLIANLQEQMQMHGDIEVRLPAELEGELPQDATGTTDDSAACVGSCAILGENDSPLYVLLCDETVAEALG